MILKVYAIKDLAADSYDRPVFFPANAVAIRSFTSEINRVASDNPYYQYPSDYVLYYLGVYDTQSATFEVGEPDLLVRGADVQTAKDCINC